MTSERYNLNAKYIVLFEQNLTLEKPQGQIRKITSQRQAQILIFVHILSS